MDLVSRLIVVVGLVLIMMHYRGIDLNRWNPFAKDVVLEFPTTPGFPKLEPQAQPCTPVLSCRMKKIIEDMEKKN